VTYRTGREVRDNDGRLLGWLDYDTSRSPLVLMANLEGQPRTTTWTETEIELVTIWARRWVPRSGSPGRKVWNCCNDHQLAALQGLGAFQSVADDPRVGVE